MDEETRKSLTVKVKPSFAKKALREQVFLGSETSNNVKLLVFQSIFRIKSRRLRDPEWV